MHGETVRRSVSKAMRNRVRAEANSRCACCDEIVRHNCHIDHVLPLWAGGTNDRTNLQCMCSAQHANKTADEALLRKLRRSVHECLICGTYGGATVCKGPPFRGVYYKPGTPCILVAAAVAPPPIAGFKVNSRGMLKCVRCNQTWRHDVVITNRTNLLAHRRSQQCREGAKFMRMRKAMLRYLTVTATKKSP